VSLRKSVVVRTKKDKGVDAAVFIWYEYPNPQTPTQTRKEGLMETANVPNTKFRNLLERRFFKTIIGFIIFLNPLAVAPQVYAAVATPSIEGVSLSTWGLFAVIQLALLLEGVRVRSKSMFWSMLISLFSSLTIIIAVLVRR
jgi:hypothetical protein